MVGPNTSIQPEAGSTRKPEGMRGAGQRVMYVDDETPLIQLAKRALTRLGYQAVAYSDPREALAAFQAEPARFDAVITDLSMPHMTGFDLARQMLEIRSDLPLVLTSGCVRKEEEDNARLLGIKDILAKPATLEAVGAALARALNNPR